MTMNVTFPKIIPNSYYKHMCLTNKIKYSKNQRKIQAQSPNNWSLWYSTKVKWWKSVTNLMNGCCFITLFPIKILLFSISKFVTVTSSKFCLSKLSPLKFCTLLYTTMCTNILENQRRANEAECTLEWHCMYYGNLLSLFQICL